MGFIFLFRFNNERERREILRRGMFILFLPCHFHTYYVQTVCADSNCSVTVRVGCGLISQVIDDILDERRVRIGLAIFVHRILYVSPLRSVSGFTWGTIWIGTL